MARNHQKRDDVGRAEDINRALELRRGGKSQRAIAGLMGCSLGRVQSLLAEGLAAIPHENAEAVRKLELERLDEMLEGLQREAKYDEKTGKLLSGGACDGEPPAIQAAVKLMERRARLLGLDAPTKVDARLSEKRPQDMTIEELRELLKEAESHGP